MVAASMGAASTEVWPWLALAGLGLFHGLNPAMGWLFAVALGLHRRSRRIVLLSWIPIALGHAAAVALVLVLVLTTGLAGLALWSFLMSSAHGAGLMLVPVLLPFCLANSPSGQITVSGFLPIAL